MRSRKLWASLLALAVSCAFGWRLIAMHERLSLALIEHGQIPPGFDWAGAGMFILLIVGSVIGYSAANVAQKALAKPPKSDG